MAEKVMHKLILNEREALDLWGVDAVENFDTKEIVVSTGMGELVIGGLELHIDRLDLTSKEMSVNGRIDSVIYRRDSASKKSSARGAMSRLFK